VDGAKLPLRGAVDFIMRTKRLLPVHAENQAICNDGLLPVKQV